MGYPTSFLGLNVIRGNNGSLTINQCGYIDKTLKRFNLDNIARITKAPLPAGQGLLKSGPFAKRSDQKLYQEIIGSLNHLALFFRTDISFAVSKLSQFNTDPLVEHLRVPFVGLAEVDEGGSLIKGMLTKYIENAQSQRDFESILKED
jgi:hypothetical protein